MFIKLKLKYIAKEKEDIYINTNKIDTIFKNDKDNSGSVIRIDARLYYVKENPEEIIKCITEK